MNDLEQYIKEKKEYFYDEMLPKGHKKRFLRKLGGKRNRNPFFTMRVAMLLLVAFSVGMAVQYRFLQKNTTEFASLPEELIEADRYYRFRVNEELEKWKIHNVSTSTLDIEKELEVLETAYKELRGLLQKYPDNAQLRNALIQNLQTRLQLLEHLNRLMENNKPQRVAI